MSQQKSRFLFSLIQHTNFRHTGTKVSKLKLQNQTTTSKTNTNIAQFLSPLVPGLFPRPNTHNLFAQSKHTLNLFFFRCSLRRISDITVAEERNIISQTPFREGKMLTCIARSKKLDSASDDPSSRGAKSLTCQLKEMALKASGSYKQCGPCAPPQSRLSRGGESDSESSRRRWGKEMEARLKGISSGEGTPSSSGRRMVVVLEEEAEPKEWVAQVEPGVLITFVSLPRGGNHLKRIRFSRDIFNKWQAQRWWAENYDKVMELYNVQRLNRQAIPLPTPPRSEDESSKRESIEEIPVTPPLSRERPPCNIFRGGGGGGVAMGYSSSDSFDQHSMQSRHYYDPSGVNSTPKVSTISAAAKTDISSSMDADASIRSSSSREADRSDDLSISNASDLDAEWVEQDEPGVYITIRALPGGKRELRRVRFSREKFGEVYARLWWEENRARIHEQYL